MHRVKLLQIVILWTATLKTYYVLQMTKLERMYAAIIALRKMIVHLHIHVQQVSVYIMALLDNNLLTLL